MSGLAGTCPEAQIANLFLWWFKGATFGREIDVTSEIWERKEASTEKSLDGRQYLGALLNASCNCFFFLL
jgi:hypothetical protein